MSTMEKNNAHVRKRKFSPRHRKDDAPEPKKFYSDGVVLDVEPLRPGARSNFIIWSRNMEVQCGVRFGDIQLIFTATTLASAYPPNPRPEPVEAELAHDPNGFYRHEHNKRVEMFLKREEELEVLKTKVYNYIKCHMTQESWEEAKRYANWATEGEEVERLRDPYLLLRAIKSTHSGHRTGVTAIDTENAQNAYQNIRQLPNQSLVDFKDYFTHKVNTLIALGLTAPTDALQAVHFIRALDDARYSELKQHYYEHAKAGTGNYPTTLVTAYTVASNHYQKSKPKNTNYGVAYVAGKNAGKSAGGNAKPQTASNGNRQKKQPYCKFHENNDHWTSDCSKVCQVIEQLKEEDEEKVTKIVAAAVAEVKKKMFITIFHSDLSDKKFRDFALKKTDVALDTGATACICKEKSLLTNLRKADTVAKIKGVGGEDLVSEWVGDMLGFGVAWYQPKAVANLVPFGRLEKKFDIQYERNSRFYFTNDNGEEINFYKMEEDDEGNGLYVYDPTSDFIAAITTVEQNKLGYSKREIRDATVARDFVRRMGYPSIADAIEVVKSGSILDCPITIQDIIRAQAIFGTDIAVLKGKTTRKKSKAIKYDYLPKPTGITAIQNLHADIFFADGKPYLLTYLLSLSL